MAMNGSPTIVEPPNSSDGTIPSTTSLSPHPSSSSDSFDSSRPNSQGSSATSRSVSPSPIPKSLPAKDSQESAELPASPSNPPLPEDTSASQTHGQNDPPGSVPPTPAASPRTTHKESWLTRLGSLSPRRKWFANAVAIASVGLTVIGMIVFEGRTYNIALWSAWNAALDTCGQLSSAGNALGSNCRMLLSNDTVDVTFPPYSHWKRTLNEVSQAGSRLLKDGFSKRSTRLSDGPGNGIFDSRFFNFSSAGIVLSCTVIIAGLSLIFFRRYWRTEEVFASSVRSDWQFTRHHQEGAETVCGEGYHMIRRNPEDNHPLGQLRQRIRKSQPNAVENPTGEPVWQTHNTSEDTLVDPLKDTRWGTSKVSLTNDTSDEKHENLIELETEGPNKTFFDPETGEFIHLTPWKSTGDQEVHGLRPDGKGSTKRALAQMTLGGIGWAGGKSIDDQLAEELQANSKGIEKRESEPHKAGDCITGSLANEVPSGKPTVDSIAAVNEEFTDDVDPKVTEFPLSKPWYAGVYHTTDTDAEGGDGDADSTVEAIDWDERDSVELLFEGRDSLRVLGNPIKDAFYGDDEGGDIDATLAKREGKYPRKYGFLSGIEEPSVLTLKKEDVPKDFISVSRTFGCEYSSSVRHTETRLEQVEHPDVKANGGGKRDRWGRLRSIGRYPGRERGRDATGVPKWAIGPPFSGLMEIVIPPSTPISQTRKLYKTPE